MANAFLNGLKSFGHDITDSLGFTSYNSGQTAKGWDQFKNGQTNTVNQQIAEQNLAFQRENFEYQKALQQKIFDREDSAYQRTVADMRQAGLSPLMMNGSNGAGEAIQTEPLHNDFQMQDKGVLSALSEIFNTASTVNQVAQRSKMIEAQINNLNASTNAQSISNEFLPLSLGTSLIGQILQNNSTSQDIKNKVAQRGLTMLQTLEQSYKNDDLKRWNAYGSLFGISSNMSEKERFYQYAKYLLDENNKDSPLVKVDDSIKEFADNNDKGFGNAIANMLPKSWRDAIDEYFENLGKKLDDSIGKKLRGEK